MKKIHSLMNGVAYFIFTTLFITSSAFLSLFVLVNEYTAMNDKKLVLILAVIALFSLVITGISELIRIQFE